MLTFVGEHTGKIDAKGRVPLPSPLFRQLGETGEGAHFVLKKSIYKDCLELHPIETWQAMMQQLMKKLNPILNKKTQSFYDGVQQRNGGTFIGFDEPFVGPEKVG